LESSERSVAQTTARIVNIVASLNFAQKLGR
jgi:hypothetical protein